MITIDKARQLIARYYDGMATPEEITALERFFASSEQLPEDLLQDAELFGLIRSARGSSIDMSVPDGLYETLETIVDTEMPECRHVLPKFRLWIMSAAAAVAVLLVAGVAMWSGSDMDRDRELVAGALYDDEVTDPQQAAEITRMALAELTGGLRKAKVSVQRTERDIDRVNEQINHIMKKIY